MMRNEDKGGNIAGKIKNHLSIDMEGVDAKLARLAARIRKIGDETKRISSVGRLASLNLDAIRNELQKILGVANLSPEKMEAITELLKNLIEIRNSLDWQKIQQENAQLFQRMQEEDLLRVKAEIEGLLECERELVAELTKALNEIVEKLEAAVKNLQRQLTDVETKIADVEEEIKDLAQKIGKTEQEIQEGVADYFAEVDNTLGKIGVSSLSQDNKEVIAVFIHNACDPEQNVAIEKEILVQRLRDGTRDVISAHFAKETESLGEVEKQKAHQEIDKLTEVVIGTRMMSRFAEAHKFMQLFVQKRDELEILGARKDSITKQIEQCNSSLDEIEHQPVSKDTVEKARELASDWGMSPVQEPELERGSKDLRMK